MERKWLAVGIILIFLSSASASSITGLNIEIDDKTGRQGTLLLDGPMNSSWPLFGHDSRHTGRSPYSTADNLGGIKWKYSTEWSLDTSPVLDNNHTIYIVSLDDLLAISTNGTEKWRWSHSALGSSSPALADDGTIYVGTNIAKSSTLDCLENRKLFAINPDGSVKWAFQGNAAINTPTIGADGTIYVTTFSENATFYAINPDGTEKWQYTADFFTSSTPAIDTNGIIYFPSNTVLHAFYPNGSLIWKTQLGAFIGSPCVGDDGTIYISDDSGYLNAIDPNGTIKWRQSVEWGSFKAPCIGPDGTVYFASKHLFAFSPNGTLKWVFRPDQDEYHNIDSETCAVSVDGTIYFGTTKDSEDSFLIAVNPDGTEKWREQKGQAFSAPAIGDDGTVYIGGSSALYAFNGKKPVIEKPREGKLYLFDKEKWSTLYGVTICIGPITIEVSYPDPVNLSKLEFYLDGEKQYETTIQPYEWVYNKMSFRKHTVSVVSTDNSGSVGTDSISFWKFF